MGDMIQIDVSVIQPNLFETARDVILLFPTALPLFFAGVMIVLFVQTNNLYITGGTGLILWTMYAFVLGDVSALVPETPLGLLILGANGLILFFITAKIIKTLFLDKTYDS